MGTWIKKPDTHAGCCDCQPSLCDECCNDNGHGLNRPQINPTVFNLAGCHDLDSVDPLWDGWLRTKFIALFADGFCGWLQSTENRIADGVNADRRVFNSTLVYSSGAGAWILDIVGSIGGGSASIWRGRNFTGDTGAFSRFAGCSGTPSSVSVTFGIPPP